jgi:hypothetical protein
VNASWVRTVTGPSWIRTGCTRSALLAFGGKSLSVES